MARIKSILFWLVGIGFMIIGILKYVNLDEMSQVVFNRAHYPKWFFYIVGAVEFIGGVLLLMTASTSKRIGSLLIGLIMLGAIGTRYMLGEPYSHFVLPGIIFLLAVLMSISPAQKES